MDTDLKKMEVAVCSVFLAVLWMSSATVLLPFLLILKYNKSLRGRWFSFFFFNINPYFDKLLLPLRKKVFDLLNSNLPKRDSTNPIKILEIGIGYGANLPFYPENSLLTALDMNPNFESHFKSKKSKYPQIVLDRLITSYAEDMKEVEDSSMDVVISTYVLCSAKSVSDCLQEIKRVLKPGGKFLFLEHVAQPQSDWRFTLQQIANPLWLIYCDGCNLTRTLADDIKKFGFSEVTSEITYPKSFILLNRPQAYGLATK